MRNKITQKEIAFYKLYKSYKADPTHWINVWEFIGEIEVVELKKWCLMSYTCPHRVFEVFDENPGLIERQKTTGKTGARYYQYRVTNTNNPKEKLIDPDLIAFWKRVKQ